MAKFFFDTTVKGQLTKDAVGLAFASLVEARAHAMTLLPVMGVELPMSTGEFRTWTITVRDHADEVICRLIMAIINDDLTSPGAARILSPAAKP